MQTIAHDPQANEEAKEDLRRDVVLSNNILQAVQGVDAIIIATEWPEFTSLDLIECKKQMKGTVLLDAVNIIEKASAESAGLQYIGVGR